jgi:hypothetical protein
MIAKGEHIHVFHGITIVLIVCAHALLLLNWKDWPLTERFIEAIAMDKYDLFLFYFWLFVPIFKYAVRILCNI